MNFRKIIGLAILPIIAIGAIFPSITANIFLYYLNGSSLSLNKHKVDFPLGHWAYFGESEYTFILSGRKIDGDSLKIEIFKESNDANISDIISRCDTYASSTKDYASVDGIQHICDYGNQSMMYFVSSDKNIVLSSSGSFDHKNKKHIQEYDLLLNSISLIE